MKKFRLTISFVLFVIISSSAQTNYHKLRKALESVPIVAEGKIVRQSSFEDENSGRIFTKNYLVPKVVFKGNTNRDTIIFLTRGGRVGDIISTVSHSVQVSQNQDGIFLLYPSRAISNQYEIFSYIERLTYDRTYEAYFEGGQEKYPSWRFMREEVGRICGNDVKIKRISSQKLAVLDVPEFCVKLANPILDAVAKKVTFDVKAKSNIAGLEFARADIPLRYPKELLGSNVVLNGKVEAIKAESTNTSFYDLDIHDIVDDKFMLTLSSSCNGGESGFVLGTEFEKIAKVTVEVQEYGDLGTINAESFDVDGYAKYFLDGACQEFVEKCVVGQVPLGVCNITSTSTQPFAAGTGQVISLIGSGFGNPSSGYLKIPDADKAWGSSFVISGTDTTYIDSWTTNNINIKIFSRVTLPSGKKHSMGSGLWEITTASDYCSQMVDVEYSVRTTRRASDNKELMVGLGFLGTPTNPNPTGTFQWYLYDSIPPMLTDSGVTIADVEAVVQQAFCSWETTSGLDIQYMGRISSPPIPNDHKFTVGYTSTVPSNRLAETQVLTTNSCDADDSFFAGRLHDADISLNNSLKWYVSLDTLIPDTSYADLFSTVIHEIGHTLLLQHSMDTIPNGENDDRLMYYFKSKSKIKRTIDPKTIKGIKLIVNRSKAMEAPGECFHYLLLDTIPQIYCEPVANEQPSKDLCSYQLNRVLWAGDLIELKFDDLNYHQAELYSVAGILVGSTKGKINLFLSTSKMMKGLYFLRFSCGKNIVVEKIVLN